MSIKKTFAVLLAVLFAMQLSTASFATAPADLNQPNAAADSADAILTPSDVIDAAEEIELTQAEKFGLPTEKIGRRTISGREFMELADAFVSFAAPEKLSAWKNEFKVMREVDEPIYRYDAMVVMYHAGQLVGGGYAEGGDMDAWTEYYMNASYFDQTDQNTSHYQYLENYDENLGMIINGYHYSHVSKVSGRHPFSCNPDNCSFEMTDYPSYADGVLAILRLIGSVQPELFDPDLFPFDKPDPAVFTDELYDKIALYPDITPENMPRWTGKVIGLQDRYYTGDIQVIRNIKEWGFNAVRICLLPDAYDENYERLENKGSLLLIDQMIAEAVKLGLHVELWCKMQPGNNSRFVPEGGTATMYHFDHLYGDKYYQDLNDEIWRKLAERYKALPSSCLTMLPLLESVYVDHGNTWQNEETVDWIEYTPQDVADYQAHLVDVIHEVDPDRIVVFEPSPVDDPIFDKTGQPIIDAMKGKPYTSIAYNYAGPGRYTQYAMNFNYSDQDNFHHSSPVFRYPFYLYEAHDQVTREYPIKIGGFLPAGTEITLNIQRTEIDNYLKSLGIESGALRVIADGEVLYSEQISDAVYNVGESISGFLTYAESEKQIKVTLSKKTDAVVIDVGSDLEYTWPYDNYDNGIRFHWSGLKVHLPEEFATEKLWYATTYDIYLGIADVDEPGIYWKHTSDVLISPIVGEENNTFNGTHDITIYDDVSYTTPYTTGETNPENVKELIDWTAEKCDGWPGAVRSEGVGEGKYWEDAKAYISDTYAAITANGLGIWANDGFYGIESANAKIDYYGIEYEENGRYKFFCPEWLSLLQQYMTPGWCEFSAGAEGQGSVSGSQMLIAGGSATLTATPDDGAEFLGWYLDGALVSDNPVYTATVTADTRLVAKFTPDAILGDLNSDGEVTVKDGVLMQRVLAELETDPKILALADLNADGEVTVKDGVKMQRILAKLE